MKAKELRGKTIDELQKEKMELLREQFNLRMQKGSGEMNRNDQFSKVRRSIARIKTILHEKQGQTNAAS